MASKYYKSIQWVHYKIKEYEPKVKTHSPRPIHLICDATYGKRKDKLGTLVFMDYTTHEILLWKHIETERVEHYKHLLKELLRLGYVVLSVTIDGKRGLTTVFKLSYTNVSLSSKKNCTKIYYT